MRPVALEVIRFRGWKDRVEIPLDRAITAIVGENKRGKSSTTNALEWCLFGGEIAKKGSGIDERHGWEISPRGVTDLPTEVRLVLEGRDGRYEIRRRRAPDAKTREPDELQVHLPEGGILDAQQAGDWMRQSGMPDWETYRRAHCFHQEAARTRVLDSADRSAILASLLGLDDDTRLREALEGMKPADLMQGIDAELERLTDDVERLLGRPLRDMAEIEKRLKAQGINGIANHEAVSLNTRRSMIVAARDLAQKLELEVTLPDEEDRNAVIDWARGWPRTARSKAPALARLEDQRAKQSMIKAAISSVTGFDQVWKESKRKVKECVRDGGDMATRLHVLSSCEERCRTANSKLKQADRRLALLRDARASIESRPEQGQCPVCDTQVPGLLERIDSEIEMLQSGELEHLTKLIEEARRREEQARFAVDALRTLIDAQERAQQPLEKAKARLSETLGCASDEDIHDILAEANKMGERLANEISALDNLANERDRSLEQHEQQRDLLSGLEQWFAASARAEKQVDVGGLSAWTELNRMIDDAAGFASDLEAVAEMAREAQEERSKERLAEVNARLGKYYALITGEEASGGIRIRTRRTARKISYELVDQTGAQAVPVLNQAAINALSLALLFAQAEEQAGRGGFNFVVLDDPVQSLDAEHQAGLAKALEELSRRCSVLVAAVPSPFVERLEAYVSVPRQVVRLAPWDATTGSRIASVEQL